MSPSNHTKDAYIYNYRGFGIESPEECTSQLHQVQSDTKLKGEDKYSFHSKPCRRRGCIETGNDPDAHLQASGSSTIALVLDGPHELSGHLFCSLKVSRRIDGAGEGAKAEGTKN